MKTMYLYHYHYDDIFYDYNDNNDGGNTNGDISKNNTIKR